MAAEDQNTQDTDGAKYGSGGLSSITHPTPIPNIKIATKIHDNI